MSSKNFLKTQANIKIEDNSDFVSIKMYDSHYVLNKKDIFNDETFFDILASAYKEGWNDKTKEISNLESYYSMNLYRKI